MRLNTIRQELEVECRKLISRYGVSVASAKRQQRLFNKRTWIQSKKPNSYSPKHWDIAPEFNPFYVRKRIPQFAHAISRQIENGTYTPKPSLHLDIPKNGGGARTIAIAPVADSAVSRWLFRRLLAKNIQKLSSYAFAYRPDRQISHAIEHLQEHIANNPRLFLVEYDFKSYFDSISHEFLLDLLERKVRVGDRELGVARAFLKARFAKESDYKLGRFSPRKKGIAQGSSLSLFLANLACIELDDDLEKTGACYARYADDTVVLCKTYSQATDCAHILHCQKFYSETELNLLKSKGISLLSSEPAPEIRGTHSFDFLGHELGIDGTNLSQKTKRKIKDKLSKIIHQHLLLYPKRYDQMSPNRIDLKARIDWDLVTCINEIRQYVYGSMTENQIEGTDPIPANSDRLGVVAFFSSVSIGDRFRELDGWLVNALRRALKERRRRLWAWYEFQTPMLTQDELIDGSWYKLRKIKNITKLPSFFNAWKAIRRVSISQGALSVGASGYNYAN